MKLKLCNLTANLNIGSDQETPEYQLQYPVLCHILLHWFHLRLDLFLVHNLPLEDSNKTNQNYYECFLQTRERNIHKLLWKTKPPEKCKKILRRFELPLSDNTSPFEHAMAGKEFRVYCVWLEHTESCRHVWFAAFFLCTFCLLLIYS